MRESTKTSSFFASLWCLQSIIHKKRGAWWQVIVGWRNKAVEGPAGQSYYSRIAKIVSLSAREAVIAHCVLNARNVAREPPAERLGESRFRSGWRLLDRAAPTGYRGSWLPSIDPNDAASTAKTDRARVDERRDASESSHTDPRKYTYHRRFT